MNTLYPFPPRESVNYLTDYEIILLTGNGKRETLSGKFVSLQPQLTA
jgi:hypothetical protein